MTCLLGLTISTMWSINFILSLSFSFWLIIWWTPSLPPTKQQQKYKKSKANKSFPAKEDEDMEMTRVGGRIGMVLEEFEHLMLGHWFHQWSTGNMIKTWRYVPAYVVLWGSYDAVEIKSCSYTYKAWYVTKQMRVYISVCLCVKLGMFCVTLYAMLRHCIGKHVTGKKNNGFIFAEYIIV